MNKNKDCEECLRIKCKNCGWEPNEKELSQVLCGKLTNCPTCGGTK